MDENTEALPPESSSSRWRHILILTGSVFIARLIIAELLARRAQDKNYEPYDSVSGDYYYTLLYSLYDILWVPMYIGAAAMSVVLILAIARYLAGRPLLELLSR